MEKGVNFIAGEDNENKYLLDELADKHRNTSKMDQPTKEILTENGIGIKSNVIFDSTKTKLIYATHNSLHVYNLLAKN